MRTYEKDGFAFEVVRPLELLPFDGIRCACSHDSRRPNQKARVHGGGVTTFARRPQWVESGR
jgi:hypothetical protein